MSRIEDAKQKRITNLLTQYAIPSTKAGANEIKIVCPSVDHKDTDASCYINTEKNLFDCHGCGIAGSAIDFVMAVENCSMRRAVSILVDDDYSEPKKEVTKSVAKKKFKPASEHKTNQYNYCDEQGKKLYASIRYDYPDGSKEFRMATFKNNTPVLGLKGGVERVPYMLEEFTDWQEIWFAEGEKCAETLTDLGIFCTCIAGGSKAKTDDIIKHFANKDVVLLPDNDEAGRDFMCSISKQLTGVVRSVRTLDIGTTRNKKGYDVYDKIQDLKDEGLGSHETRERLNLMKRASLYEVDGEQVRALSKDQREAEYQLMLLLDGFDLGDFIPNLKGVVRPLIPGDCLCVTGATASGKTSMLQAMSLWAKPMTILVFNAELSTGVFYEREASASAEVKATEVEERYRAGERLCQDDSVDHIFVVPISKLTPDEVRKQFFLFVKMYGKWPDIVEIDYLQLMKGKGVRYEQVSDNAEEIRLMGHQTDLNAIMAFTSQKSRAGAYKKDENGKPSLGDSKGSGSIENSSSVYMDLRPHQKYPDVKVGTILKNTRGPAGVEFEIGWKGEYTKFIAGQLEQSDEIDTNTPPPPDHTEAYHDEAPF